LSRGRVAAVGILAGVAAAAAALPVLGTLEALTGDRVLLAIAGLCAAAAAAVALIGKPRPRPAPVAPTDEARIERLASSQRELIANVSHELRTPLSRVRVILDLVEDGGDPAETRERVREINRDFAELERLVDDILTAARLDLNQDAGLPLHTLRATSLDDLVHACVARFKAMHGETHVLDVSLPEPAPRVFADELLLRRALSNILDNARKYSNDGSTIRLEVGSESRQAVVRVVDQGVGIGPEDLGQIFTPFFRGDRSRTRSTGGVGLGLAITKRIIEAHKGRIALDSAVGRGTTVRIELPELQTPARAQVRR
jgi:two-component system, OmpR family, sensor kinase